MQYMSNKNLSRGSEWSKWDLHIHTPCSIVQEYGGNTTVFVENVGDTP